MSSGCRFVAWEQVTSLGRQVWRWDRETGKRVMVSHDRDGKSYGQNYKPSISANGRYVAFTSFSPNLVVADSNGSADVFVRDRITGSTERVSVTSGGVQAAGGSSLPAVSDDDLSQLQRK